MMKLLWMLLSTAIFNSQGCVRAAHTCSTGNELCKPWDETVNPTEIRYGTSQNQADTTIQSIDTDYDTNIYIGGITNSNSLIYGGSGGNPDLSGFVARIESGVTKWSKFAHSDNDADGDAVIQVPWVGISRKFDAYTYGCENNFVGFYMQRAHREYIFWLDGTTGAFLIVHEVVQTGNTDLMDAGFENFLLQNIVNAGQATLTNYRIFIAYEDTTTMSTKKWQLQSRSEDTILVNIDSDQNSIFQYGARCLTYQNGKLWFGGSRDSHGTWHPLIGRADATTLVVEEAHFWDATSGYTHKRYRTEKIYTSQNAADHLIIGLASYRRTTMSQTQQRRYFMLIIGRDDTGTAWLGTPGCWSWSSYLIENGYNSWHTLDDIVGPLTVGGKDTLYIFSTHFNSQIDSDAGTMSPSTWNSNYIRVYKIQDFLSITCNNAADQKTGTSISTEVIVYKHRCQTYACTCSTSCVTNTFQTCGSIPKNPVMARIMSSSRTLDAFVAPCSANLFDLTVHTSTWYSNMGVFIYKPVAQGGTIRIAPTIMTLGWRDITSEFVRPIQTVTPVKLSITGLLLTVAPTTTYYKRVHLNDAAETYPKEITVSIFTTHDPVTQTHYGLADANYLTYYSRAGSQFNYTLSWYQVTWGWINGKTQIKISLTDTNIVRTFPMQIIARNVLYTGVSSYWYHYFCCNPDNSGTTYNQPSHLYGFWAVQQTTTVISSNIEFEPWNLVAIHTGCVFSRYNIQADSSYTTDLSQVSYRYTADCPTGPNCCTSNAANCKLITLTDKSYARTIRYEIGAVAFEDSVYEWMPAKTLVFPIQQDIVRDRNLTSGSIFYQETQYMQTLVTPTDSYALSYFEILWPGNTTTIAERFLGMTNPTVPTTHQIWMYTENPFTEDILWRAHTVIGGNFYWDFTFNIRVCGSETLTTMADPADYTFLELLVDQSSTNRYIKIDGVANFSTWFVISPPNDPCVVNYYSLESVYAWDYVGSRQLTVSYTSNSQVNLVGQFGAQVLWLDRSITNTDETFYLMARTRGQITAARKMRFIVCPVDTHQKTSTYNTNLEYLIPKDSVRLGLTHTLQKPSTDWSHMVTVKDCSYCAAFIKSRLMMSDGVTQYTGSTISMDSSGNINLPDKVGQFRRDSLIIQYYLDAVSGPLCSFVQPITIPFVLEVCGSETVLLKDQTPINIALTWRVTANSVITNLTSDFIVASPSTCKIVLYELWPTTWQTLAEHGPTVWSQFVTVDNSTGDITVNHNNNPGVGNSTYKFYLTALSMGLKTKSREVQLSILYPFVNNPPTFDSDLEGFKIKVLQEDQIQGNVSPYLHYFPSWSDEEGDNVTARWREFPAIGYQCRCIKMNFNASLSPPLWIEIDTKKLREQDAGQYMYFIDLIDETYEIYYQKTPYTFSFEIEYELSKYEIIRKNTGKDTREIPKPLEKKQTVDIGNGEPEVKFKVTKDGIFVYPTISNLRAKRMASKKEVDDVFELYDSQAFPISVNSSGLQGPSLKIDKITMDGLLHLKFSELLGEHPFMLSGFEQVDYPVQKNESEEWAYSNFGSFEGAFNNVSRVASNMKQLRNASRAEKATLRVDVNQTTENKGRRRLFEEFPKYVALDQINVTRDVLKFEFMLQSFTDPVELRYDLYIKNWTTTGMILHVNFSEPLLVSKGQLFDNAKVRIINPALFRSQQTGLTIPEVQDWMVEPFPVQVGEGVNLEALKAHAIWLTSVVHACIILTVAILTYLGAFPYLLWNCYFTLQLISYIPRIFKVHFPATALLFLDQFYGIVEFDFFNPETYIRWFYPEFSIYGLWFEEPAYQITNYYQHYKILDDWAFFCMVPVVYGAVIAVMVLLSIFLWPTKYSIKDKLAQLYKMTFYGYIIRFLLVTFLKTCVTFATQIDLYVRGNKYQEKEWAITGYSLGAVVVCFPCCVFYCLRQIRFYYHHVKIRQQIGILYHDLHYYRSKQNIEYYPMFLVKRLLFVLLAFVTYYSYFQIQVMMFLTQFYICWYTARMPHEHGSRTFLEIANECTVMLILYLLIIFSDYNLDEPSKVVFGYFVPYILAALVFANLAYVIMQEIDRQEWLRTRQVKRNQWNQYMVERSRTQQLNETYIESNKIVDDLKEKDPDMFKPKLFKQTNLPETYKKKVHVKPNVKRLGLDTIKEEVSLEELEMDINEAIYNELGNFGDIVEISRKQILEGFVRPPGKYAPPEKVDIIHLNPLPEELEDFKNTFEESKAERWLGLHDRDPGQDMDLADVVKDTSTDLGSALTSITKVTVKFIKETKFFGDSSDDEDKVDVDKIIPIAGYNVHKEKQEKKVYKAEENPMSEYHFQKASVASQNLKYTTTIDMFKKNPSKKKIMPYEPSPQLALESPDDIYDDTKKPQKRADLESDEDEEMNEIEKREKKIMEILIQDKDQGEEDDHDIDNLKQASDIEKRSNLIHGESIQSLLDGPMKDNDSDEDKNEKKSINSGKSQEDKNIDDEVARAVKDMYKKAIDKSYLKDDMQSIGKVSVASKGTKDPQEKVEIDQNLPEIMLLQKRMEQRIDKVKKQKEIEPEDELDDIDNLDIDKSEGSVNSPKSKPSKKLASPPPAPEILVEEDELNDVANIKDDVGKEQEDMKEDSVKEDKRSISRSDNERGSRSRSSSHSDSDEEDKEAQDENLIPIKFNKSESSSSKSSVSDSYEDIEMKGGAKSHRFHSETSEESSSSEEEEEIPLAQQIMLKHQAQLENYIKSLDNITKDKKKSLRTMQMDFLD